MSRRIADWLQWNTERKTTKGKNLGNPAMSSSGSYLAYVAALQRHVGNNGGEWNPTGEVERILKRICRQYGAA